MADLDVEKLLKSNNDSTETERVKDSQKLSFSYKAMQNICNQLSYETNKYKPEKTIRYINEQVEHGFLDYISYSEISDMFFSLDDYDRDQFVNNTEKLKKEAFNEKSKKYVANEKCKKIVAKIYDHTQLAVTQVDIISKLIAQNLYDTKTQLKYEAEEVSKENQKRSITILSIFSSIVLTFVGGMVFSSSILENMHSVSVYRLIFTICILAMVIFNVIFILIKSVFNINNEPFNFKKWCFIFDGIGAAVLLADGIAWILNLHAFREYIFTFLPWIK